MIEPEKARSSWIKKNLFIPWYLHTKLKEHLPSFSVLITYG